MWTWISNALVPAPADIAMTINSAGEIYEWVVDATDGYQSRYNSWTTTSCQWYSRNVRFTTTHHLPWDSVSLLASASLRVIPCHPSLRGSLVSIVWFSNLDQTQWMSLTKFSSPRIPTTWKDIPFGVSTSVMRLLSISGYSLLRLKSDPCVRTSPVSSTCSFLWVH